MELSIAFTRGNERKSGGRRATEESGKGKECGKWMCVCMTKLAEGAEMRKSDGEMKDSRKREMFRCSGIYSSVWTGEEWRSGGRSESGRV